MSQKSEWEHTKEKAATVLFGCINTFLEAIPIVIFVAVQLGVQLSLDWMSEDVFHHELTRLDRGLVLIAQILLAFPFLKLIFKVSGLPETLQGWLFYNNDNSSQDESRDPDEAQESGRGDDQNT